MKAVLISIQPKWCELIASGKKTVEVRKTKPKIDVPFKCYIYETQGRTETPWIDEDGHVIFKGRGQVIGEFVCDKVVPLVLKENGVYYIPAKEHCGFACMTVAEARKYGKGKPLYAWHISDLAVYDKPKELWELKRSPNTEHCGLGECDICRHGDYDQIEAAWFCRNYPRPPQSWCYVEERSAK